MQQHSSGLAKNILATIVYYDCMDFAMTSFEIWKYLLKLNYYEHSEETERYTLEEVLRELEHGFLIGHIEQKNGFYFLKGRQQLAISRITGEKISSLKIRRLSRIVSIMRFVPFVEMIAITGKLAMKSARPKSDLDVLVVFKDGYIWTGRTVMTLLVHLLGKRRYGKKIADRVCFNYFITVSGLEVITKDVYSASEYSFMMPIFGWSIFNKFQIKNGWIRAMKPLYDIAHIPPMRLLHDSNFSQRIRAMLEKMFSSEKLERFLKKIEHEKIMHNPKTAREGSIVHAYDDALIFLPEPKGPKIFEQFKEKMSTLLT